MFPPPLSVFVFLNEPMSPCLGLTVGPVLLAPFPGNTALAEASRGQARADGGGVLPANHMIVHRTAPALHDPQMLQQYVTFACNNVRR